MSKALEIGRKIIAAHNDAIHYHMNFPLFDAANYSYDLDGNEILESTIPINVSVKKLEELNEEDINFIFVSAVQEDVLRLRREKLIGDIELDKAGLCLVMDQFSDEPVVSSLFRYYIRN